MKVKEKGTFYWIYATIFLPAGLLYGTVITYTLASLLAANARTKMVYEVHTAGIFW